MNSVFDLAWSVDDTKLLTASGDCTAGICDVETGVASMLVGHCGSVKSIRNSSSNASVYATAARDGKIFLWDDRTNGSMN
jgi:denticleless